MEGNDSLCCSFSCSCTVAWEGAPVAPADPLVLSVLQDVIQVSKKYLPGMAVGYSSAKLTLHVGDGFEFMKQNQEAFDVIITDSSDPMGKNSGHKRALLSILLLFSPPASWK